MLLCLGCLTSREKPRPQIFWAMGAAVSCKCLPVPLPVDLAPEAPGQTGVACSCHTHGHGWALRVCRVARKGILTLDFSSVVLKHGTALLTGCRTWVGQKWLVRCGLPTVDLGHGRMFQKVAVRGPWPWVQVACHSRGASTHPLPWVPWFRWPAVLVASPSRLYMSVVMS